jgi:hypothetical protein
LFYDLRGFAVLGEFSKKPSRFAHQEIALKVQFAPMVVVVLLSLVGCGTEDFSAEHSSEVQGIEVQSAELVYSEHSLALITSKTLANQNLREKLTPEVIDEMMSNANASEKKPVCYERKGSKLVPVNCRRVLEALADGTDLEHAYYMKVDFSISASCIQCRWDNGCSTSTAGMYKETVRMDNLFYCGDILFSGCVMSC